ncbi:hypothetical protein ACFJIX_09910 [Roseateles sp. UC29_93]|uniref:hypothetical protein n=1 Tax=Roseateles sp. UC29_93 TaxID=3350177 RepID=UPI003671D94B
MWASKATCAHSSNASMPMKCIDQMPPPRASAPVARIAWRRQPLAGLATPATCSASAEVSEATASDSSTSGQS